MNLEKLKFIINEKGTMSTSEKKVLLSSYKELFKEIYGYDILSKYEKNKLKLKNTNVFEDTFINSIDVLKSLKEDENISLLMVYNENNNIVGFGRIKKIKKNFGISFFNNLKINSLNISNDKVLCVSDFAIVDKYCEYKYDLWKKSIKFIESVATIQGYDKLYVEIPLNSPLLFRADDLGFAESPEDIPVSIIPRTRILNKFLEGKKDAKFNSYY